MTELQMGLIGLGVVTVIGTVAYNKWQERKHRRLAEHLLSKRHSDVLLDEDAPAPGEATAAPVAPDVGQNTLEATPFGERMEPVLRLDPRLEETATAGAVQAAPTDLPPDLEPVAAPASPSVSPSAPHDEPVPPRAAEDAAEATENACPPHLLSPAIDYIAAFEAIESAPAYQILEAQRDALSRVRKPVRWIGYNERTREWEPIVDDGNSNSEYRRIRIGLQLVDRNGPANDNDLSVFHVAMQDLADELMAIADLPPRQPAIDAAAQLDAFCADVDIQIGINVVSQGQVFPGTKLRALAEAAGMAIDGAGRFVRCDDDGNVLYLLSNQEAAGFSAESMKTMSTHGVTFLLDVPRVAHGDRVFNQMVDLARRFAEALHGALVDDNRRPLSESALEPIRRQVAQYQSAMAARHLPAGGPLTLRLFS